MSHSDIYSCKTVWMVLEDVQKREIADLTVPIDFTIIQIDSKMKLADLWYNVVADAFGNSLSLTKDEFEAKYIKESQIHIDAVYFAQHIVSGEYAACCCACRDNTNTGIGRLHWLATRKSFQGRGLGRLLALKCIHHHKCNKLNKVQLKTESFRSIAMDLYFSLGFVAA